MRIDELLYSDGISGHRYKTLKRNTPMFSVVYDCKSGEWDFSKLDELDKEQATKWITDCRRLREYEKNNNIEPFWYSIFIHQIVHTMEDTETEMEWPERLQKYQVNNIAEAYLIDKHELYELAEY